MCLWKSDITLYDNLKRPLPLDDAPMELWSDRCDYVELDECNEYNPKGYNFIVLQLNIRSILANQLELKMLLNTLKTKNSNVDAVLLSETFLTDKTLKLVNIEGYILLTNHRKEHKGGGVAILVRSRVNYQRRKDLEVMVEKEVESCFMEIKTKSGKKIIVGSLYRSPNTKETELINHVQNTIVKCTSALRDTDIVMGMDHNLDLLKLNNHKGTRLFYDKMVELELIPSITRPTRITNHSATLIDNIFVCGSLQKDFDSSIIISDISDHLPSIFVAKQTKVVNTNPIEFESRCLSETKISKIKKRLDEVDWHGTLNSDSSSNNFDMLMKTINATMDQEALVRIIRRSGKRRFVEPWITTGLDNSARTVRKLFRRTLQSDANLEAWEKYRTYRNMYNRTKRLMMVNYYKTKCEEYKTNTKRLWEVLNRVIGKSKNAGISISHLTVDGIKVFDKKAIANKFGRFYANMGKDLAGKISPGNI